VESKINDLKKRLWQVKGNKNEKNGEVEISIDETITNIHDFNVNTEKNICLINNNMVK
jgi:hypothetical protein